MINSIQSNITTHPIKDANIQYSKEAIRINHNRIYRGLRIGYNNVTPDQGKYLPVSKMNTDSTTFNLDVLHDVVEKGDFSDIYVGDYIQLYIPSFVYYTNAAKTATANFTARTIKWVVVGIDSYLGMYGIGRHHLVLWPTQNLVTLARTPADTSTSGSAYGAVNDFCTSLAEAINGRVNYRITDHLGVPLSMNERSKGEYLGTPFFACKRPVQQTLQTSNILNYYDPIGNSVLSVYSNQSIAYSQYGFLPTGLEVLGIPMGCKAIESIYPMQLPGFQLNPRLMFENDYTDMGNSYWFNDSRGALSSTASNMGFYYFNTDPSTTTCSNVNWSSGSATLGVRPFMLFG